MSKPDWLDELCDELRKLGSRMRLDFDTHFVLVEEDYLNGREPDDVAAAIAEDRHPRIASFSTIQNAS